MSKPEGSARLRVIFITFSYPSKENPIEAIFVREHAKAVSQYAEVTVLHSRPSIKPPKSLYQISDEIEDNLRVVRVYYRQFRIPSLVLYSCGVIIGIRHLRKQGFRPHLIHAHFFFAGLPSVLLGRLFRLPVIITEHWSGFPLGFLRTRGAIIAKFVMSRAQWVCPVSENLKEHIESYGIKARFKVIPNAVNTKIFFPNLKAVSRTDKKKLLFVGSLIPLKGIHYLLMALNIVRRQHRSFQLDIVGNGPHKTEYEEFSKGLGLEKEVYFHGLKTKEDVAIFMKQCDFLILPSIWENQPNVLIEAMACGKPVIATNVGGVPEIIKAESGLLIPPRNIHALAEAIGFMIKKHGSYDSSEIASYARERFGYAAVGLCLNNLYRKALPQNQD